MSGLFDTLIAAAQGQASAIAHRPRQRFDGSGEQALPVRGLVVEDEQISAPDADAPAVRRSPPLAVTSHVERGQSLAMSPEHTQPLLDRQEMASPPIPASEPALGIAPDSRATTPFLQLNSSPLAASASYPAEHPLSSADSVDAATLLPAERSHLTPAAGQDAKLQQAPSRPDEPTRDVPSDTPRFELRIGRIEVTNPRARTVASAPSARPVSIPRAKPRQSLDDYLRGRKR